MLFLGLYSYTHPYNQLRCARARTIIAIKERARGNLDLFCLCVAISWCLRNRLSTCDDFRRKLISKKRKTESKIFFYLLIGWLNKDKYCENFLLISHIPWNRSAFSLNNDLYSWSVCHFVSIDIFLLMDGFTQILFVRIHLDLFF